MFSTLISAGNLKDLLGAESKELLVFDCRHRLDDPDAGRRLYLESHIPGALFAHLDNDLSAPIHSTPDGHSGRHPLPDPDVWMKRLGEWNVTPAKQVVVYDDAGGAFAARLWWMLQAVGHEAAAVLDGGWKSWGDGGGESEEGEVYPNLKSSPYPGQFQREWIVSMPEVREQVESGEESKYLLVDARAPDRYRGETEPVDPIPGHIPGALNMSYQDNLDSNGAFLPPDELRKSFEGVVEGAEGKKVVMYCGSGVTACHNLLAIAVAGLPPAHLFPNSWSGWSNTPGLPAAKGEG